jgi:hypothetical protein
VAVLGGFALARHNVAANDIDDSDIDRRYRGMDVYRRACSDGFCRRHPRCRVNRIVPECNLDEIVAGSRFGDRGF